VTIVSRTLPKILHAFRTWKTRIAQVIADDEVKGVTLTGIRLEVFVYTKETTRDSCAYIALDAKRSSRAAGSSLTPSPEGHIASGTHPHDFPCAALRRLVSGCSRAGGDPDVGATRRGAVFDSLQHRQRMTYRIHCHDSSPIALSPTSSEPNQTLRACVSAATAPRAIAI
jgi:hypothetical protein